MVIRPPCGIIASRALIARFSSEFASCDGSIFAVHSPTAPTISRSTSGPVLRPIMSAMPWIRRLTSVGRGSSV